jgi:hypothetical protein
MPWWTTGTCKGLGQGKNFKGKKAKTIKVLKQQPLMIGADHRRCSLFTGASRLFIKVV